MHQPHPHLKIVTKQQLPPLTGTLKASAKLISWSMVHEISYEYCFPLCSGITEMNF